MQKSNEEAVVQPMVVPCLRKGYQYKADGLEKRKGGWCEWVLANSAPPKKDWADISI